MHTVFGSMGGGVEEACLTIIASCDQEGGRQDSDAVEHVSGGVRACKGPPHIGSGIPHMGTHTAAAAPHVCEEGKPQAA